MLCVCFPAVLLGLDVPVGMLILSLVFSDGVLVLSFSFSTTFSAAAEGTQQGGGILNLSPDFNGSILALA